MVGGASGVDPGDLDRGGVHVVSHGLVEADDQPPELGAGAIASLVAPLTQIAAVEPGRSRLDRQADRRPGDVEMDRLARRERQRVLANGSLEPDPFELLEQGSFEVALCGAFLAVAAIQPPLDLGHTVLAPTSMPFEVVGGVGRGDQPEMPRIFGGSLEAMPVSYTHLTLPTTPYV